MYLDFSIEFYDFSIKVYLTKDKVKMGMNYCLNKAYLNQDTDGTRFKQILSKILIYSNILLSQYMSGTTLDTEDTTVNKTRSLPSNKKLSEIHGHSHYSVLHGSEG